MLRRCCGPPRHPAPADPLHPAGSPAVPLLRASALSIGVSLTRLRSSKSKQICVSFRWSSFQVPPFPTPWLPLGFGSPRFNGTMKALRLPLSRYSSFGLASLRLTPWVRFCFALCSGVGLPSHRLDVVDPGHPFSGSFPKRGGGPHKFPGNLSVCLRPALRPRSSHLALAFALQMVLPPRALTPGAPTTHCFEAQSHGLGFRCLRFVPPSRMTTQDSLPAAG